MSQVVDHSALDGTLSHLCGASHWYVGFSGGVDSTVLLHLVQSWRKAHPTSAPPLTAIHVNHGLQDRAREWERHCAWICQFLQVPFVVERVEVEAGDAGPEAAARDARYGAFEGRLAATDVLFLGHHLDDQVETFFLRLLRGSGVRGLAAMPAQRLLGAGQLVRPLLHLGREQLEAHAVRHGLKCIEDPTNSDSAMDRNYLRHEVLPHLADRWPAYRQTVSRASEHMASAAATLESGVELPETCFSLVGDPGFSAGLLEGLPEEAAALLVREWLRGCACQAPDQSALAEFLRQLRESRSGASPRLQTGQYILQRYLDTVYLTAPPGAGSLDSFLLSPGETLAIDTVGAVSLLPAQGQGIWLAPNEELDIRWRAGGERCRPVGRDRSTSLKKLLQERQVPPWWRDRVPLLYLGEELLAVGDLWACRSSRYGDSGRTGEACYKLGWEAIIPAGSD